MDTGWHGPVKEQKSMYNVQSTYHMLRCTYCIWHYYSVVWLCEAPMRIVWKYDRLMYDVWYWSYSISLFQSQSGLEITIPFWGLEFTEPGLKGNNYTLVALLEIYHSALLERNLRALLEIHFSALTEKCNDQYGSWKMHESTSLSLSLDARFWKSIPSTRCANPKVYLFREINKSESLPFPFTPDERIRKSIHSARCIHYANKNSNNV